MRAALTADIIAEYADFVSFGTNDLSQTTFGISGDDAETGFLIDCMEICNTAENVLQQVDCSVLTVKPEGFVFPVKLKAASIPETP